MSAADFLLRPILPRSLWDARVRKYKYEIPVHPVTEVYIHHGATNTGMSLTDADGDGAPDAEERVWRGYQNHHMDNKGWSDIAYNFGVGLSGQMYFGRGWRWQGGATGNKKDRHSLSICAIGNFEKQKPTQAMIDAIVGWILLGIERGDISPNVKIYGHRDAYGTTCPGTNLYRALPEIRSRVANRDILNRDEDMDTPINAWYEHLRDAPDGAKDEAVRTWQVLLVKHGFMHYGQVDGVKGPVTRGAHSQFEAAQGYANANDKPGEHSWNKLLQAPPAEMVEVPVAYIPDGVVAGIRMAQDAIDNS